MQNDMLIMSGQYKKGIDPKWNILKVGQKVKGVAYNWGGSDTIEKFKEKLEKGIVAGNTI